MKKRSPIAVALLGFPTLGIYWLYWLVKTKGEMNSKGEQIPTAIMLIIPFVNIYWLYLYSKGVNNVTKGQLSTAISFLLIWLLGFIGYAIIQDAFNSIAEASPAPAPQAKPVQASPAPPAKVQ